MSSGGPETPPLDMNEFIKLASGDREKMEFDALNDKLDLLRDAWINQREPGETYDSWFKRIPREEIIRLTLEGGGKVIKFSDYHRPKKIHKINLSEYFDLGRKLTDLSKSERETLSWLLNKSLNPKD